MNDVCRPCGACCALLPVSFPAHEGATVPSDLTQPAQPEHLRMLRGESGACVALEGAPGAPTACAIYRDRPVVCRDFEPSRPGAPNVHCDEARARLGLSALVSVLE